MKRYQSRARALRTNQVSLAYLLLLVIAAIACAINLAAAVANPTVINTVEAIGLVVITLVLFARLRKTIRNK